MILRITLGAITNRPQTNDGYIATVCREAGQYIQENQERDLGTACSVPTVASPTLKMNNKNLSW